jgi:hypothetical protein
VDHVRAAPVTRRWRALGALVLVACWLTGGGGKANAHIIDTSACHVDIARDSVIFTFTFDLRTLARITPVDANGDGQITPEEVHAAGPAIEAFLRSHVIVELNDRRAEFGEFSPPKWPADAGAGIPSSDWGQRLANFTFRNALLNPPDAVALTFDLFEPLGKRHTVLGTFAWNGREDEVIFTELEPDYLYDTGYRVPAWDQFLSYLRLGIMHIFTGYDHIAFLLALLFVRKFTDLLKIITGFSVGHTMTLVLAATGVFSMPSRLVESGIAVSIIYVAAQNLRAGAGTSVDHRWKIAFGFGLIHGFGFASVLRELGLPSEGLIRSLLAFNLGVEVGQVAIAAVCWPILRWVMNRSCARVVRLAVSAVLLAFGAAWLTERAFALHFMPI